MKTLVLGNGGREHALLTALSRDPQVSALHAAPGNAGMADLATLHAVEATDPAAVVELARELGADLVVVGPEAPLAAGVSDALREAGFAVFGPSQAAAQLEASKAFAKEVMAAAGVPTAGSRVCTTAAEAAAALDEFGAPHVVKDDGLAAGKGVVVTSDRAEALAHAEACFAAGGTVVIEDFLDGPEVSLFVICDGEDAVALTPAQDFKRIHDGDAGPNTGGMGAYSPLPWLAERFGSEQAFVEEVTRDVALPVVRQLDAEGTPFIGLLYAGLILTPQGVRVIEFNARFGDPETQVVLPRLETPLSQLLFAAASGTLEDQPEPVFRDEVAITVVLASEGYPEAPQTGRPIEGLDEAAAVEGVRLVHAATASPDAPGGSLIATGGRVLNVVAVAPDFRTARDRAYDALGRIRLEGSHHRTDIAARVAD